jgi:hypothetical protein
MRHAAITLIRFTAVAAALMLAACQRNPSDAELAKLDNQITGNEADPALTSALEDQIATDPALQQQSNKNAVRPAQGPLQAQYPLDSKAAAGAKGRGAAARPARTQRSAANQGSGCDANFDYNMQWARRLPPAFPVLPGARITEAAGNDKGTCRMRVVSFTANVPPERVLDWYRQRAAGAGYSAEHQMREGDHVLAGTNEADNGAYYLIVTPMKGGGSDVSLIANNGG